MGTLEVSQWLTQKKKVRHRPINRVPLLQIKLQTRLLLRGPESGPWLYTPLTDRPGG